MQSCHFLSPSSGHEHCEHKWKTKQNRSRHVAQLNMLNLSHTASQQADMLPGVYLNRIMNRITQYMYPLSNHLTITLHSPTSLNDLQPLL